MPKKKPIGRFVNKTREQYNEQRFLTYKEFADYIGRNHSTVTDLVIWRSQAKKYALYPLNGKKVFYSAQPVGESKLIDLENEVVKDFIKRKVDGIT